MYTGEDGQWCVSRMSWWKCSSWNFQYNYCNFWFHDTYLTPRIWKWILDFLTIRTPNTTYDIITKLSCNKNCSDTYKMRMETPASESGGDDNFDNLNLKIWSLHSEWMQEVFSGDELCQSLMKEAETKSETLDIHFILIYLTSLPRNTWIKNLCLPCLEQVFCLICRLQSKHMLFLGIVRRLCC